MGDYMSKSIWQNIKTSSITSKKDIETDILIIGGGITGLTTLLNLKNENIILIEANQIGMGISAKTTGKISIMQEYNYQNIEKTNNKIIANQYLESQIYAVNLLKKIIKEYDIECDFKKNSSYLFTNDNKNIPKVIKEKNILSKYINCEVINSLPNNYPCIYGIKTDESYVFNPLKYINKIKEICPKKIYENTRAISIQKKLDYYLVKTNKNKIKTKKIIICTHYPFFIEKYKIPLKTTIEKEYVLSSIVDKAYNANMISNDDNIISIRYYEDKNMIFASNKEKLCNKINHRENMENLIRKYKNHFPYKITNTWYNYDIISNDYLPIIGKIKGENILFATAFNKWGMTNSVLAANIMSDIIKNNDNEYINLFSPYRKINKKKILNSITYILNNIKAYLNNKQKFIKYKNNCGIEYAIYKDKLGKEHKVINRCPHMKCKLTFNEIDKTWDCPCHGSRFNIDGKILKGPSTYSIIPKK